MSLVDISLPPTAEKAAIHLHTNDNVAIARVPLPEGQAVQVGGIAVVCKTAVPMGPKVCLKPIAAGEMIVRYGQAIGRARKSIEPGEHVHVHNVAFEELHFNYEFPEGELPLHKAPANARTFRGYRREDGRVGTRNYIAVVAASNCAAHRIRTVPGAQLGDD